MANSTVTLTPRQWVEITAGDIAAARFQASGVGAVHIMATVGQVAPASLQGTLVLNAALHDGISADQTLANLFPGVTGANRLYAYLDGTFAKVSISHA